MATASSSLSNCIMAHNRSEDLFLGNAHGVFHIGKDGGRIIAAAFYPFDFHTLAAGDEFGAFFLAQSGHTRQQWPTARG